MTRPLFEPRYVVDGHLYDHPDSDLAGDGAFAPFFVFDAHEQRNIAGPFDTRAEGEAFLRNIFNNRQAEGAR